MKVFFLGPVLAILAGCAVPTTGVIPRSEGMYTVTRQGEGAWVQTSQLTALATKEGQDACAKDGKQFKLIHVKEIPAAPFGRWPESEVLFQCIAK